MKKNKGYTMIELLTVLGILVVVSGIISGIIYATLRGSGKTKITTAVAQNGNYALSILSNIIVGSIAIDGIGSLTQVSDPPFTDCTSSPTGQKITLKTPSGAINTLACEKINNVDTVALNGTSIIDTTQVKINTSSSPACTFTCSQKNPYDTPVIQILLPISDSQGSFFENKASAIFQTSISLRNFKP